MRFEQRRRPLKIGIHRDVLAALEVPEKDLARALRIYTANAIYRRRLHVGATRIDLNGSPAGVVTPDQVAHLAKPVKQMAQGAVTATTEPPALKPSAIAGVKRMSLADLRAAAQRRKAGAESL